MKFARAVGVATATAAALATTVEAVATPPGSPRLRGVQDTAHQTMMEEAGRAETAHVEAKKAQAQSLWKEGANEAVRSMHARTPQDIAHQEREKKISEMGHEIRDMRLLIIGKCFRSDTKIKYKENLQDEIDGCLQKHDGQWMVREVSGFGKYKTYSEWMSAETASQKAVEDATKYLEEMQEALEKYVSFSKERVYVAGREIKGGYYSADKELQSTMRVYKNMVEETKEKLQWVALAGAHPE